MNGLKSLNIWGELRAKKNLAIKPKSFIIFAGMEQQPIFIITGEQGEGKTTRLKEVVKELKKQKFLDDVFRNSGIERPFLFGRL